MTSSFESTKFRLDAAVKDVALDTIASRVVETISRDNKLSREIKKDLLAIVRAWHEYVEMHNVKTDDLFTIRWHIQQFAREHFPVPEQEDIELLSAPIDSLVLPNGQRYTQLVKRAVGYDIVDNPDTALFGGVARIALKLRAAQQAGMTKDEVFSLISPELPASDVDIIMNRSAVASTGQYNADLAGTRIVGDIEKDMHEVLANVDLTFNQTMAWQGKIYYTQQALDDARTGTVRFTEKEDALFGAESFLLEDGKRYINRKGFYRAFAFLLRNKARAFPVYKDNLDREASNIGRYWIILLSQKILPIKDIGRQARAISDWFNLSRKLGAAKQRTPDAFLMDLLAQFPEGKDLLFKHYQTPEAKFEDQVRWLSRKLIKRALTTTVDPDGPNRLSGMSDEQIVIDRAFYRGPQRDQTGLLKYIVRQKQIYNNSYGST